MKIVENGINSDFFHIEKPFDFAAHSSIGIGGKAKIAYYPRTLESCVDLLNFLQAEGIPYVVVGNLTNVLPKDEDTDNIVVCTKKLTDAQIGRKIFVQSGIMSGQLLRACRYAGKSGIEFLNGIPCTLGGAVYMNAGVNGAHMEDVVESVLVWINGETQTLTLSECEYAYKSSVFMKKGGVILGATLALKDADVESIAQKERYYARKRSHLPKGKSMGCVFKNPPNESAGELIERAGFKGRSIGEAYVSETHANFIINRQRATARDVRALIRCIQTEVEQKFDIKLQEEIRYLT